MATLTKKLVWGIAERSRPDTLAGVVRVNEAGQGLQAALQ